MMCVTARIPPIHTSNTGIFYGVQFCMDGDAKFHFLDDISAQSTNLIPFRLVMFFFVQIIFSKHRPFQFLL